MQKHTMFFSALAVGSLLSLSPRIGSAQEAREVTGEPPASVVEGTFQALDQEPAAGTVPAAPAAATPATPPPPGTPPAPPYPGYHPPHLASVPGNTFAQRVVNYLVYGNGYEDDASVYVPVDFVVPYNRSSDPFSGSSALADRHFGTFGVSIGGQLPIPRNDTDSAFKLILKSLGYSLQGEGNQASSKEFSVLTGSFNSTITNVYDWVPFPGPGCYTCQASTCCTTVTGTVNVYGAPNGARVTFQEGAFGVKVWLALRMLRNRVIFTPGLALMGRELRSGYNSNQLTRSITGSLDGTFEVALRVVSSFAVGSGIERSLAGFGNEEVKFFVRIDLARHSGQN